MQDIREPKLGTVLKFYYTDSAEKFVCLLYTFLKYVIYGSYVIYILSTPDAAIYNNPPPIFLFYILCFKIIYFYYYYYLRINKIQFIL